MDIERLGGLEVNDQRKAGTAVSRKKARERTPGPSS